MESIAIFSFISISCICAMIWFHYDSKKHHFEDAD